MIATENKTQTTQELDQLKTRLKATYTFVQFYPTLLTVAKEKGTLK